MSKLVAPDGQPGDEFGSSVTITEDLLVVGAGGENSGKGAAYLFNTNGGFEKRLQAFDGEDGAWFGYDVAAHGDIVAVGTRFDEAAYIYTSEGDLVKQITAPDGNSGFFGDSVDVSDNFVAVGALSDDNENGLEAGAVYLFTMDGEFVKKIFAPDGQAGDRFGVDVSIAVNRLVVGAEGHGDNGWNSGSAYLYLL